MQVALLADSVEDNDVIVDGVTDDRQDSGDKRLVDIQVERKDSVEQGEEADDDDSRMGQGDDTAETPGPSPEPQGDVAEDDEEGEELMTVNVSRSGKVTIGDDEDEKDGKRR